MDIAENKLLQEAYMRALKGNKFLQEQFKQQSVLNQSNQDQNNLNQTQSSFLRSTSRNFQSEIQDQQQSENFANKYFQKSKQSKSNEQYSMSFCKTSKIEQLNVSIQDQLEGQKDQKKPLEKSYTQKCIQHEESRSMDNKSQITQQTETFQNKKVISSCKRKLSNLNTFQETIKQTKEQQKSQKNIKQIQLYNIKEFPLKEQKIGIKNEINEARLTYQNNLFDIVMNDDESSVPVMSTSLNHSLKSFEPSFIQNPYSLNKSNYINQDKKIINKEEQKVTKKSQIIVRPKSTQQSQQQIIFQKVKNGNIFSRNQIASDQIGNTLQQNGEYGNQIFTKDSKIFNHAYNQTIQQSSNSKNDLILDNKSQILIDTQKYDINMNSNTNAQVSQKKNVFSKNKSFQIINKNKSGSFVNLQSNKQNENQNEILSSQDITNETIEQFQKIKLEIFSDILRIKKPQVCALIAGQMLCKLVNSFRGCSKKGEDTKFVDWINIQDFVHRKPNVIKFNQEVVQLIQHMILSEDYLIQIRSEQLKNHIKKIQKIQTQYFGLKSKQEVLKIFQTYKSFYTIVGLCFSVVRYVLYHAGKFDQINLNKDKYSVRDIIRQSLSKNRQSEMDTSQSQFSQNIRSDEKKNIHQFGIYKDQSQSRSRNHIDMEGYQKGKTLLYQQDSSQFKNKISPKSKDLRISDSIKRLSTPKQIFQKSNNLLKSNEAESNKLRRVSLLKNVKNNQIIQNSNKEENKNELDNHIQFKERKFDDKKTLLQIQMKEYQDKLNEKVRMIQTPLKSSQTQNQDANTENQNSHFSKINDKLTIKSDQKLNQFISSIENKNSEQKKQKLNIYSQVLQNQKQQKLYQKISLNSNKNINSSHKKIATLQNDYQIQNYLKQAADKVKINSQNIFLKNSDYQIEKIIEKENQQIPVQIHQIDQFKLGNSYEKIKNSTKRSPISQNIKAGNNLQKEDQSEENKSSKYNIYSYKPVQTLDLKYQTSRKLVDESTPISDSKINTNKQRKSRKDRCSDRKSFNKDYVQTDYQETIQIQRDDVDNLYSQDKDSQNQRFILNEFMQIEQSLNNKEIEFQNMNMTNSLKLEKNFIIHQSRNESQQFQQQQLSQLSIMDQIQKTVPSPLKQSIKPQQITSLQSLNVLDKQEDFMSQINQNSQFSSQINKQITKDQEIEFENDTKYFAEITEFESSQNFEQKIQSDEKLFLDEIDIEVLKEEKQSIQLSEECHSEDIINPAEEARRIVDLIKTQLLIDDSNKSQTDKSFNFNSSKINNYNTVIKCISPKKELYNNQLQQKNDNQEQIIYDETNISENSQEQVIKPDQENIEFINNLYEEKRIIFENQSNKIIKLEEDQNITIKDQAYNSVNQQDSKESKEENEEFYMQEILSPFRNLRMSNVGQGLISSPSDKKDLASDKQWQINPVKVRRCPSDQIEFMDKQFQNQHFSYTMEYPTFINNFNNQQNEEINQILRGEISPGIIKSIYTNQRSEMIERLMQTQRTIEENSPTRNSNVNIEMIQRLKQKRLTQRSKSRESIINSSLAQIDL